MLLTVADAVRSAGVTPASGGLHSFSTPTSIVNALHYTDLLA